MEFLAQKGVEFVEKNVRTDEVAMKELIDHSLQGTPVTMIDGQSVVGFDQLKIMEVLGL